MIRENIEIAQLTHTRSCPSLTPGDGPCTCALVERIALQTEQTMRMAWRKRAEEAETRLAIWQPIETAPLDGTEVDLWCSNPSALTAGAGRVPDCHYHLGDWLKYGVDNEIGWIRVHNATHWMKIPEGPTA